MSENFLILKEREKSKLDSFLPDDNQTRALADFFQNLADSTRIKILSCLSLVDLCVNDICKVLSLNQTTVSHQLALLKAQGVVSSRRDGKILIYSLSSSHIEDVLSYASESL